MNGNEQPPFSVRSLLVWLALGFLGIGLAVAIALVARNLADQPVGIAGEPVSAGRALDPPRSSNPGRDTGRAKADRGSNGRKNEQAGGGQSQNDDRYSPPADTGAPGDSPGGGSTEGSGSGSGDDSSSGGSDDSHDDGGDHDGDDD